MPVPRVRPRIDSQALVELGAPAPATVEQQIAAFLAGGGTITRGPARRAGAPTIVRRR